MTTRLPTIAEEDRDRERAKEARRNATVVELHAENEKLKKTRQKIRNNIPTLFLKRSTVASVRALTKAWQCSTQGKEVRACLSELNEARARIEELERLLGIKARRAS
jgi:hypothetical protein